MLSSFYKIIILCSYFADKVIEHHDGDSSSPNSLKDGAAYNLIKGIDKNDLHEEKLLIANQ